MRILLFSLVLLFSLSGQAQHYYLFVGTYTLGGHNTPNGSKGIYVYDFDAATGDMKPVSTADAENPSYLALAPGGDFLYATNETILAEPLERIKQAITLSEEPPEAVPLVSHIFTRENAERYLKDAIR